MEYSTSQENSALKKYYTLNESNKLSDSKFEDVLKLSDERYYLNPGLYFTCIQNYQYNLEENSCLEGKNLILISTNKFGKITILSSFIKRNFKIFCINHKNYPWASDFFDEVYYLDDLYEDLEESHKKCLEIINKFSTKYDIKFDGIMTLDDRCTLLTSRLAKSLGFKGIDYNSALNTYNKYEYKQIIKQIGLFDYYLYKISGENIKDLLKSKLDQASLFFYSTSGLDHAKSYIIKDVYGCRKNFISKFSSADDLQKIFYRIDKNESLSCKSFVIEEFFKGMEFDLDIIIQNNKIKFCALTENEEVDDANFFEISTYTPTPHVTEGELNQIKRRVEEILEALKISESALHFEAFCKPKSKYQYEGNFIPVYPIECNLRIGGSSVNTFMQTSYKYNLMLSQIKVAFGIEIEDYNYEENIKNKLYCASKDLIADKTGVIKEISFAKDFFNDDNFVDIVFMNKVGDYVKEEDYQMIAFLVAKSDKSYEEAKENLKKLLDKIEIKIEDEF